MMMALFGEAVSCWGLGGMGEACNNWGTEVRGKGGREAYEALGVEMLSLSYHDAEWHMK